jgi:DNA polymerase-3 subunit chi
MTEITFHLNANNKLDYCCRLLRKAYTSQAKVVVKGSRDMLKQLDQALWNISATDFIPHCNCDAESFLLNASPIVLTSNIESLDTLPHHQVLLNIDDDVAPGYEKFERVIEIVGDLDEDKAKARIRWRHYSQRGYPISTHEINKS